MNFSLESRYTSIPNDGENDEEAKNGWFKSFMQYCKEFIQSNDDFLIYCKGELLEVKERRNHLGRTFVFDLTLAILLLNIQ